MIQRPKTAALLLCGALFPLFLAAQTYQTGWVTEINSSRQALPGVQLIFYGAPPTDSDNDGYFSLAFQDKKPGDLIVYNKILKQGYELVNEKELQTAKLSNEKMTVVLAPEGYVAQKQAEYYGISIDAFTASFEQKIKGLEQQLQDAEVSEENYMKEYRFLQDQYNEAVKRAGELAEKYARTNFDDVSDIYRKAFDHFQKGEIDSALIVLENANLVERARKRIDERQNIEQLEEELAQRRLENEKGIREDMQAIKLAAEMYELQYEYDLAEAHYHSLWELDTLHVENTMAYAIFLKERKSYDKALLFFDKLILMPGAEPWQNIEAHLAIGVLYTEIGKFNEAFKSNYEARSLISVCLLTLYC
jgi:hypothetical protein